MESVGNSITGGRAETVVQAQQVSLTQHFHGHGHGAVRAPRRPFMLPWAPEVFVDRTDECGAFDELVAGLGGRRSPLVTAVVGPAGVGKTGLVVHWAHGRREDFPGGVFYAEMSPRESLRPVDAASVLETFIGALGTPRSEMPAELGALAAHFRLLTEAEPSLVVLDGVVTAGQVGSLLPGHPASMVLVTSRNQLVKLRAAGAYQPEIRELKVLEDEDCTELFLGVSASERQQPVDDEALRVVIPALAGLPIAARVAGALAADPLYGGVRGLARQLAARSSLVEVLEMGDVFAPSYQALDAAAQRAFRVLGAHPTREFADALVEEVAGGGATGLRVRRTLLEGNLLERAAEDRCRMNRLVHEYAAERARADAVDGAVDLLVDWYLRRSAATDLLVSGRWRHGPLFARPELLTGVFDDEEQALDAMEADRENLAAVAELALRTNRPEAVCRLAEATHGFFFRRKHHALWLEVCRHAVEAAEDVTAPLSPLERARTYYEAAFAHVDRGAAEDLAAARGYYERALEAARSVSHGRTASSALEGLGQIAARQGRPAEALELFGAALRELDDIDHPRGRALLEYHQGWAASAAGRHEEAARRLRSARRQFAALSRPDRYNEARSLTRYAQARLAADRPDEALAPLDEALALFEGRGAPKERADVLLVRGDVRAARGEGERAAADWESALATYREIGSVRAEEARGRLSGTA
ncbi:NB-ARC domain-containing protein [Streptomyces sp. NPDC048506]|uniref:NB-ARC domain-containing protein n=1 Tax=Streptomyces sp. NPDC048506 TaxID=3155028 RepID=UPI003432B7E1